MSKSQAQPSITTRSASETSRRIPLWKRKLASASRWLHIYVSMAGFGILLFFAVTGLTLNHTEWFAHQQRTWQYSGSVKREWVKTADVRNVAKLEVVEQLRRNHGVKSALSDFRIDDTQCSVSFKGPGYSADAFIDRESGRYEMTETRNGFFAVINDLHKGRDSGKGWSLLIDAAAVLMTFVALTGMVLILFLEKRRMSGLIAMGAGVALCYAVYVIWVP